jgi:hypothetical protein
MATTDAERLRRVEDQLADVIEQLSGGPRVSWERSVRGRLHLLATQEAARMLRDQQAAASRSERWTRGEKLAGALFALVGLSIQFATLLLLATGGHG